MKRRELEADICWEETRSESIEIGYYYFSADAKEEGCKGEVGQERLRCGHKDQSIKKVRKHGIYQDILFQSKRH